MALTTCTECKKEMSDQAKVCPHCGAKRSSSTAKVVIVLIGIIGFGSYINASMDAAEHASPAAAAPVQKVALQDPAATARANADAATAALDPKGARAYAAERLKEFCVAQDPHLNYITVKVRPAGKRFGIFCVHDFYTKYGLSSGRRGPALGEWVTDHRDLLMKANIATVGIWGTGAYASGAWFEVK